MKDTIAPKKFEVSKPAAAYILIICCLLYMMNHMDKQVFAATVELIKQELGLSDSQVGIIQTMFLMGIAVFAFPAAYLVDRWSRRKAVSFMAILWSAFTFVTGLAASFLGILIPRSIVGVGEAGFASGGTPLIAAAFTQERRSLAMGIFTAGVPLGSGLGIILGGIIAHKYGWRVPFYSFAVPGIILGILAYFMKDYKTIRHVDQDGKRITFFSAAASCFRIPTLKYIYLGFTMQNMIVYAFLTWAPAFVMRVQGIETDQAAKMVGIIGLMALIGSILGGVGGDIWQKRNPHGRMYTASLGVALATILYAVGIFLDLKGVGFIIGILFGILISCGLPPVAAVSQDVSPPSLKGVSYGMNVFCMFVLGGGWAPLIVGAISQALGEGAYGLKVGLMLMTIGGILSAFFYYLGSRHYPADMKKVEGLHLEEEGV